MADEIEFYVEERRAYATKQRPRTTTMHGPFCTRGAAQAYLKNLAFKVSRNTNRSSLTLIERSSAGAL